MKNLASIAVIPFLLFYYVGQSECSKTFQQNHTQPSQQELRGVEHIQREVCANPAPERKKATLLSQPIYVNGTKRVVVYTVKQVKSVSDHQ